MTNCKRLRLFAQREALRLATPPAGVQIRLRDVHADGIVLVVTPEIKQETYMSHTSNGQIRTRCSAISHIFRRCACCRLRGMKPPAHPFDPANKLLFSHPRMAADLIRLLDDDWIDELDFNRMERLPSEHVLDDLHVRREDLPWLVRYKEGSSLPGAGIVLQFEFQSRPDADMLERMAEYWALQRRHLRRSQTALGPDGEPPLVVPVVVHTGRRRWTPPRQSETQEGNNRQPPRAGYFEYRLIDVKDYLGDHARDGNLARAVFALDAAPIEDISAPLHRVAELLREAADPALSRSFEQWCRGVLGEHLANRLLELTNLTEEHMLAETIREWEERSVKRGREEGREEEREEGIRRGREEKRQLLCGMVAQRFGGTAADDIKPLMGAIQDETQFTAVGALIIDSTTRAELLASTRRLVKPNGRPV